MIKEEKQRVYRELLHQWQGLASEENDRIALLANTAALLHHTLKTHWTGFYLVKDSFLILGPFQGPVACSRIPKGRGVCGQAWADGKSLVVADVHSWPGHIACSPYSNSEIVVPVCSWNYVVKAVLDVDSTDFGAFDEVDRQGLETIMRELGNVWDRLSA
ncbi:MAG: GAF domain-containing protein [Flavobacteriales bacterium]|nr:GAF domain-containing protein [Flavobacteriales bacterium]MDW8431746.1 GAF domain-containing protein [Flavobacteriales bacterium]